MNRWEFPLGLVSEKLSHDCLRGMSFKMTISLSKKIWECCSSQMAMLSVLPVYCSSLSWLLVFGGLLLSVLLKHHDVPSMTATQVEMSEVCVLGVWLLGCINFLRVSLFGESLLKLFWREKFAYAVPVILKKITLEVSTAPREDSLAWQLHRSSLPCRVPGV